MPKFMKVATTDALEDQQAKLVEVEGQKIALFRVGEAFYALSDMCTPDKDSGQRRDRERRVGRPRTDCVN